MVPAARLLEDFNGRLRFALPPTAGIERPSAVAYTVSAPGHAAHDGGLRLSQLFGAVEAHKQALGVSDYSLSQTTCVCGCEF